MNIDGRTCFTGIIGHPVGHTLSPTLQNAAFSYAGLNWVYLPFNVASNYLKEALSGLAACGCRGLNVTMPHKAAVIELVDKVDESAKIVRAVNTVEFDNGRMVGHNTDGYGFILSLSVQAGFDPRGKGVAIAGAGGAARSIAVALAGAGAANIKLLNRTERKAEDIVGLIRANYPKCSVSLGDLNDPFEIEHRDLIVNATSVGMDDNPGLPLPLDRLKPEQLVYDIIYQPARTEFLRLAQDKGARTLNGLSMLVFQGAAAFTIWTKRPAPLARMAAVLGFEVENHEVGEASATDKQSSGTNTNRSGTDNPGTAQ